MCGADAGWRCTTAILTGLPPRVRGRRLDGRVADGVVGTTPACAGQTVFISSSRRYARDYPRVCGADFWPSRILSPKAGLPPRVRGRLNDAQNIVQNRGTTPACAGQTCNFWIGPSTTRDYPRVCGADWG